MAIETPLQTASVPASFLIAGYAFDPEATANSGVDAVVLYGYHNFGSNETPVFLGTATYGLRRDDVAATFGSPSTMSGFQLNASGLAPGRYRVYAFAHNIATNAFSAYVYVDVTVEGVSALSIEAPAATAAVSPMFDISGWAIDSAAPSGTGIDAVHLYLAGHDGADAPAFLGVATYGVTRLDIAAAYGARFAYAGYQFKAAGVAPGSYLLLAYAHSTATGSFSVVQSRRFVVDATALLSVDGPSAGAAIDAPTFAVNGWAIDRSAANGPGVDALHVYAFRSPSSGEPPVFLGIASIGIARSDVAAIYGSRFENSGFQLDVNRAASGLTPGDYDIVVWSHSAVTNTFAAVSVVHVTLR